MYDYSKLATVVKLPPDDVAPKGIIQFVHGMCERKERYDHVAEFFARNGYICAVSDLRGHGSRASSRDMLGYFGKNGDVKFVEDTHFITLRLKEDFPNLPFILLGHSMGSLIVRSYTKKYAHDIDMLIICGSPSNNTAAPLGILLIKVLAGIYGWRHRSQLVKMLVSGNFELKFISEHSKHAWLSTDPEVRTKFANDELCSFTFTLNGYYCLLNLMMTVYSKDGWNICNPLMPVHFISGADDPCKINDKKFAEAVNMMREVGYENVSCKLYDHKRHELFNETNKEKVFADLLEYIESV